MKRPRGWLKEERRRALGRLMELSPPPLGRLAAPGVLGCQRLRALAAEALADGNNGGPARQAWGRCMEALHAHWGGGFGEHLRREAARCEEEGREGDEEGGVRDVLEALTAWARGGDSSREGAEGSAREALGPGGVFSGADVREEEGRAWKRFRRATDWSPCALGNLPDASDPNGVPPALFAAGRTADAVPVPFRAGPEDAVQAAARQGGGTTPGGEDEGARETKKMESSSSEEVGGERGGEEGGGGGEEDEELYIQLL